MSIHSLAGKAAPKKFLINVDALIGAYYDQVPNIEDPIQRVSFGTSGHRGSSLDTRFNENHILATTQAICDYRASIGIQGPLFVGKDTHALSGPATDTTLEVLAANGVEARYQSDGGFTPTPVISNAILSFNRNSSGLQADGIVITPSHNPPRDGGFKYNPPSGGPAGSEITQWVEKKANEYLGKGLKGVKRFSLGKALTSKNVQATDFKASYINGLQEVIDFDSIRSSGLKIGTDPLGGAGTFYWAGIAEKYGINLSVVNERVDPTFSFMRVDWDGKIRMDCSSPSAMASLIELRNQFDIAFGNDPDFDRHGIVTPDGGLMNPNHYLAVAIDYLFTSRSLWPESAGVGKTLVSSSMIDRVAKAVNRSVYEVPVGFKWFVDGLLDRSLGFGGEESAGASFLTRRGNAWSTDKDGFILNLLAAEMTSVTGLNPSQRYNELTALHGQPAYSRVDAPSSADQKKVLSSMSAESISAKEFAGEPIQHILTHAPGNGAAIGGLKVSTKNSWFAARPSGTEDIFKLYAESFLGDQHLESVLSEAQSLISDVFRKAGI
ncbi:MAG: phosphoglucomutase (alpha-D-glucose-1,6-bisphosphate-dependent) [Bacteroidetes bacterium]|nr:phosphoglucomutase (alpha-D-glucose-1,6-bisphosphate-dependent) [Bacteroidota bacterium]